MTSTMPVLTDEYRARLIEVATKRLGQYQTMKQSQGYAGLKPRGGIAFDYQLSIDLMEIALDLLKQKGGWKLVPIEPTPEMMVSGTLESEFQEDPAGMYRAMIAAAPKQPSTTPQIENDGREG